MYVHATSKKLNSKLPKPSLRIQDLSFMTMPLLKMVVKVLYTILKLPPCPRQATATNIWMIETCSKEEIKTTDRCFACESGYPKEQGPHEKDTGVLP